MTEFRAGDTMKVANFELTALDYDNAYIFNSLSKNCFTKDDLNQNGIFDEDEAASEKNSEDEVAAN